jgi:hypothetical protein
MQLGVLLKGAKAYVEAVKALMMLSQQTKLWSSLS